MTFLIIFFCFVLVSAWLFAVIYFSVKLAINSSLLNKPEEKEEEKAEEQDFGLVKLRDIEVLSNDELEEAIKLLQNKSAPKEEESDYEQYKNYEVILYKLIEMGYFTVEQYSNKIDKLKAYYNIERI